MSAWPSSWMIMMIICLLVENNNSVADFMEFSICILLLFFFLVVSDEMTITITSNKNTLFLPLYIVQTARIYIHTYVATHFFTKWWWDEWNKFFRFIFIIISSTYQSNENYCFRVCFILWSPSSSSAWTIIIPVHNLGFWNDFSLVYQYQWEFEVFLT